MSKAEELVFPIPAIREREEDIQKWTRAGLRAQEVVKLLEVDCDGLLLGTKGEKK